MIAQYGWNSNSYALIKNNNVNRPIGDNGANVGTIIADDSTNTETDQIIRKPYLDVLGYTTSIAAKMTGFVTPNQIMIGQSVFENLDSVLKSKFEKVNVRNNSWDYINPSTGNVYDIYSSTSDCFGLA